MQAVPASVVELLRTAEILAAQSGLPAVSALYRAWLQQHETDPLRYTVLFNHAVVLSDLRELAAARAALEQALALNPAFIPTRINLGRVLEQQGDLAAAVTQWNEVAAGLGTVTGDTITWKTTALNQTARVLEAASQDASAEEMLRQSLDLDTTQREPAQHYVALRQRQCSWPVIAPSGRITRDVLMKGMSPLSAGAFTDDALFQLALAAHYNRTEIGAPATPMIAQHHAARRPGRLRIGYVSSDLREHAVGYLMAEMLELHDRGKVEVFTYYCGPATNDPLHQRFRAGAEHWTDISGMSDAAAARQIAYDGVQILVDVNGYTREGRTKLFALRPAPVIVNWLGFPGTCASPYHHYIVADEWIIPPSHELYYSEQVLRLPCYQPNDRKRVTAPERPTRAEAGLPENATVFCCFNGAHKITRFAFDRWLAILERVPGSVLWLLTGGEVANTKLRDYATAHGIAAERIIFAPKAPNAQHLARYPLADLFLDTMPYGAHTTASDALWCGVPVLTCSGRSFASRVCGSLVRSAGLPELVCADLDQYVDTAVALGRNRATLAEYRRRLEANRDSCVLFDSPLLVRSMEGLYAQMWQACQDGRLPQPDLRNLDAYLDVACSADYEAFEAQRVPDDLAWWEERLRARHAHRPLLPDGRAARWVTP